MLVPPEDRYQSFLLRCWLMQPASAEEPAVWRFGLREVSPDSQELRFADFAQLMAHLSGHLPGAAGGE